MVEIKDVLVLGWMLGWTMIDEKNETTGQKLSNHAWQIRHKGMR